MQAQTSGHIPVLLHEVLDALNPQPGEVYLDGTFGGGGYSRAILERADCTIWAIDRDPQAIARGAALAAHFPGRLHLVEGRFGDLVELLGAHGVDGLDGVVLDLGVSSFQIDDAARGFSFRNDGPLDMRMSASGPSAADLVATLPAEELADILYQFGEEQPIAPHCPRHRRCPGGSANHHDSATGRHHSRRAAAGSRRHSSRHAQLPGAPHQGE